ncbi:MAG: hypothetical protein KIT09_33235 [Bryobacteraceae bacterium]|nr:hypothetical protein [Bryobacteraceae bacterium]
MRYTKSIIALAVCLALAGVMATMNASQWNKKTEITFSAPVQVPGKVLPAGTYVFKLANSDANRHIVQVFNEDESEIQATVLAINDYRARPSSRTIVTFGETAGGTPTAVKAWFYPGDTYGQRFVYSRDEAAQLARTYHQQVPYTEGEVTERSDVGVTTGEDDVAYDAAQPGFEDTDARDTTGFETDRDVAAVPDAQPRDDETASIDEAQQPAVPPQERDTETAIAQDRIEPTEPERTEAMTEQADAQPGFDRDDETLAQARPPVDPVRPGVTNGQAPARMPDTASNAPLMGLIGLMLIGAGAAARYAVARSGR